MRVHVCRALIIKCYGLFVGMSWLHTRAMGVSLSAAKYLHMSPAGTYLRSSFSCYSDLFPLDWLTRVTFTALNVVHPQSEQEERSTEQAAVSVSNKEE